MRFELVNIELRSSRINGIGVFAARSFKRNEFIAEGIHKEDYNSLITWHSVNHVSSDILKRIYSFCIGTPNGFFPPDGNDFNKLSGEWYINHSCNGNVGFNKNGDFVSLRSIRKNEELAYDYALAESNPEFVMACNCGSKNCRKTITGNDYKEIKKTSKKYNYIFPFLVATR